MKATRPEARRARPRRGHASASPSSSSNPLLAAVVVATGIGGEQIEGRQAVRELLRAGRRRVREVWLAEGIDDRRSWPRSSTCRRGAGAGASTATRPARCDGHSRTRRRASSPSRAAARGRRSARLCSGPRSSSCSTASPTPATSGRSSAAPRSPGRPAWCSPTPCGARHADGRQGRRGGSRAPADRGGARGCPAALAELAERACGSWGSTAMAPRRSTS